MSDRDFIVEGRGVRKRNEWDVSLMPQSYRVTGVVVGRFTEDFYRQPRYLWPTVIVDRVDTIK